MAAFIKFILLAVLGPVLYFEGGCQGYHVHTEGHSGRFRCYDNTGLSVAEYRVCDGYNDCWDGSDELGCHRDHGSHHHHHQHHHSEFENVFISPVNNFCTEMEFQCQTRYSSQCIPRHWVCDNYVDCIDGRDEEPEECSCAVNEKLCENYYSGTKFCVPWHMSCNSYYDTYFYAGPGGSSLGLDHTGSSSSVPWYGWGRNGRQSSGWGRP